MRSLDDAALEESVSRPAPERIFAVAEALHRGWNVERVSGLSSIDPWFIDQVAEIVEMRKELEAAPGDDSLLRPAKRMGFSDRQIAYLWGETEDAIRRRRRDRGVHVTYKTVDTCAAEFEALTPYMYGTFEEESEVPPADKPRVIVLGSGPNRIGQGIEFDYCCVHASFALRDAGYETVMVNCNPETVSTDYDTSDRLCSSLSPSRTCCRSSKSSDPAVIVQLGGRRSAWLKLSEFGVRSPARLRLHRRRRGRERSRPCAPARHPTASRRAPPPRSSRREVVDRIGLPVLVRPSYPRRPQDVGRLLVRRVERLRPGAVRRGPRPTPNSRGRRSSSTGSSKARWRSTSTPSTTGRSCWSGE